MIKKIIFDLDNTLLFISDRWISSYQSFIDEYNLNITAEELYDCIGNLENESDSFIVTKELLCDYINKHLFVNIDINMLDCLSDKYKDIPLINPDITYDILDYLSKKYELVFYSNWFTDNQINRLKKYDLYKFFSRCYGWDILPLKPSKEGIKKIVGDDDINEYVFIGDSIKFDLEIPDSMGMNTIFYNRKNIKQEKYKEMFDIKELKKFL